MDYFNITYELIKIITDEMTEDGKTAKFNAQKVVNHFEHFAALTKHLKGIEFYKTSLSAAEELYSQFDGNPLEEKIKGIWFAFLDHINEADGELAIREAIIQYIPLIDRAIKEVGEKSR